MFFKYRDTIIIGGSMIHNHMEYELKRDVSKILGESLFFIEFKNTYENLKFINTKFEIKLESFVKTYEEIKSWYEVDEDRLLKSYMTLNREVFLLLVLLLIYWFKLKEIEKNELVYVISD